MGLAALQRSGSEDLIVFLHGLGCVKENFAALWDTGELAAPSLLAVDLPGHGASHGLPSETWAMEGMATCVRELLERQSLNDRRIHLVAHSMGGAVGLLLAQDADLQIASFINVEGNLIASDCGLLSRRTAEMDPAEFRDGKFEKLKASARRSDDPIVRAWAGWMETCDADALHACARSVVEWSDSGRLLGMFASLTVPRVYVYGDKSANPDVLAHLGEVPKREIADCGHFVSVERPVELARIIARTMAEAVR